MCGAATTSRSGLCGAPCLAADSVCSSCSGSGCGSGPPGIDEGRGGQAVHTAHRRLPPLFSPPRRPAAAPFPHPANDLMLRLRPFSPLPLSLYPPSACLALQAPLLPLQSMLLSSSPSSPLVCSLPLLLPLLLLDPCDASAAPPHDLSALCSTDTSLPPLDPLPARLPACGAMPRCCTLCRPRLLIACAQGSAPAAAAAAPGDSTFVGQQRSPLTAASSPLSLIRTPVPLVSVSDGPAWHLPLCTCPLWRFGPLPTPPVAAPTPSK